MRKIIALLLAFSLLSILPACKKENNEHLVVYAFSGENAYFSITNGKIVLSDSEEVFYGGRLQTTHPGAIANISAYTATFYTLIDGQQEIIFINSFSNFSSSELLDVDFGKKVTHSPEISKSFQRMDTLQGSLWCELNITDHKGNTNHYNIALELIAITP